MPLRFRAPYIPRYFPRGAARGAGRAAAQRPFAGGPADTSSTGNVGGDIVKAINNTITQNRQNALANQILNTQNPPRAGLVAPGVNPATGQANVIPTGVSTTGTAPQTGGVGQLQFQGQMNQQALADQIQRAKLATEMAKVPRGVNPGGGSGNASRWRTSGQPGGQPGGQPPQGKAGKPTAYVAGSGDVENDANTDNFGQIQTDFDAQHGKGQFAAFSKNLQNLRPDGQGNLVLMKPPADDSWKQTNPGDPLQGWTPIQGKNGLNAYSIPQSDAPFWTNRLNAARIRGGQQYLGNLPDGVNSGSGVASGQSQINPIQIPAQNPNLFLRSMPMGTWLKFPDGSVHQKVPNPTTQQQQPTEQASVQPTSETSDTSDAQDQERAAEEQVQEEDAST